eukprot:16248-Heterococcus_DN1.PRE.1
MQQHAKQRRAYQVNSTCHHVCYRGLARVIATAQMQRKLVTNTAPCLLRFNTDMGLYNRDCTSVAAASGACSRCWHSSPVGAA